MIENKNREIAVLTKQLNTARDQVSALKSSVTNLTNEKVSAESDLKAFHSSSPESFRLLQRGQHFKKRDRFNLASIFSKLVFRSKQRNYHCIVLVIPAKRTADAD